ncbi:Uncharacterised protein [Mycobacteroides abscessus subsp. abscessus]|nr:Uncharacterised protein [Mycobacteroides abscessus subsp. abscessus]
MATFDLLGRCWVIAALWELRVGPIGFRDLRRTFGYLPRRIWARVCKFVGGGGCNKSGGQARTYLTRKSVVVFVSAGAHVVVWLGTSIGVESSPEPDESWYELQIDLGEVWSR